MSWNPVPWDIYIDENKTDRALGFLVVPNTASFAHKLFLSRHPAPEEQGRRVVLREVHWADPHGDSLAVERRWIDCFFSHLGTRFFLYSWHREDPKELVVLQFLRKFCTTKKLEFPYNVVVFLDYDSDHAKIKIQNTVRETGGISRCYHVDSKKNDCIQLCDLLLGASGRLSREREVILDGYESLQQKLTDQQKIKDSEMKRYRAGYLAHKWAENVKKIVDFRVRDTDNR